MVEASIQALNHLRLHLSKFYYAVSSALSDNKLDAELQKIDMKLTTEVWVVGERFDVADDPIAEEQTLSNLFLAVQSIPYMTYRSNFPPITTSPTHTCTSDAGWGCTLRSGQMMLALAIQRHTLGTKWRIHKDHPDTNQIQHILTLFLDSPSPTHCPFSIHNLCLHGAPWGVAPGKWLGPLVTCKALEAATAANSSINSNIGLTVITIGDMGGGAPTLFTSSILASGAFKPKQDIYSSNINNNNNGVLILVPLVLGLGGRLNTDYIPQLQAIMSLPHNVGLIGGRPGSSSYIIGYQESALALDPHIIQDAVVTTGSSTIEEGGTTTDNSNNNNNMWDTYRPRVLRPVPFEDLDASLALGFYCRDEGEFEEMCLEVEKVGERWKKMPLMCVSRREKVGEGDGEEGGAGDMERSLNEFVYPESEGGEEKGAWELL